jgi:hypothetical protein
MRGLKTIVAVLTVLLVGALGVFVYGLSQNWHRATSAAPPAAAPAAAAAFQGKSWGRVTLGQPADSRVQAVTAVGNLVVVQVTSGGDERLLVLDPATGAVVGTFALTDRP